jgi:membrane fusion protein, multidrug efflux system
VKSHNTPYFIAIILILFSFIGCDPEPVPEKKPVIRPVVTHEVQDFVKGRIRTFPGTAKAALKTYLSFRVGGEVTQVNIDVGDYVKAGKEIARLDASDYKMRVQQRKAELARVEAALIEVKASFERIRQLFKKQIVTRAEMDVIKAKYDSTMAQKNSVTEALNLSRKQLAYTSLNAPIEGDILEVFIEVHQAVQAGQAIAAITNRGPIEMEIGVPARLISRIKKGAKATIKFDALPDNTYQAVVKEVSATTSETSTFPVTLKLIKTGSKVKPGMVGEATFMLKATTGDFRVIVPAEAVVGAPGKKYFVWVLTPETKMVSKQAVTIGNLTSEGLQIKSGIEPGTLIVTRGVNRMEDGMQVRLLE